MRHIAIIGSGPAGYYTAEAAQKAWEDKVNVDVLDLLPVPYGLIRSGVAPDHQSIKQVARRFEGVALSENVRFVGNVAVGRDVSVDELLQLYDAVVLATGAPNHVKDGIQPLTGLVETDWLPFPFTMNWIFPRPGKVRFEKGEPFCFITLTEHRKMEQFEPVMKSLESDPVMQGQFDAWNRPRSVCAPRSLWKTIDLLSGDQDGSWSLNTSFV